MKRGLHAPGQDDDDWGRGVRRHGEPFPEHERGGEDEGEVEDLREELAGLDGGEGEHFSGWLEVGRVEFKRLRELEVSKVVLAFCLY